MIPEHWFLFLRSVIQNVSDPIADTPKMKPLVWKEKTLYQRTGRLRRTQSRKDFAFELICRDALLWNVWVPLSLVVYFCSHIDRWNNASKHPQIHCWLIFDHLLLSLHNMCLNDRVLKRSVTLRFQSPTIRRPARAAVVRGRRQDSNEVSPKQFLSTYKY